jgi:hypothetical protein
LHAPLKGGISGAEKPPQPLGGKALKTDKQSTEIKFSGLWVSKVEENRNLAMR